MTDRTVSAVVIGRNEGSRLVRCLESLQAAVCAGFVHEIVYVDSDSTDGSVARAQSLGATTIVLKASRPTAARGRNAGWRAAKGSLVLFLDGDTVLEPNFVAHALDALDDPGIAIVWGHRRELYPEASIYNRVLDLDWVYAPGETAFCGGDALVRRSALDQNGGFDESLIAGEEPELCRRIRSQGHRILHLDQPMTGHDLAITRFGQYWGRAVRAGHAFAEVSQRFRHTADPFWASEVRRNRNRALGLVALPAASLLAAIALRAWWPLLLCAVLFACLAARTAFRARSKSDHAGTLLLYAVHSHLQQIPIFCGQLLYRFRRRRGHKPSLIDYKAGSPS